MGFIRARRLAMAFIISALVVAIAGVIIFGQGSVQMAYCVVAVLALAAAGIIVMVKFCRCKNCGKVIFAGLMKLEYCPKCRHSLITGMTKKQENKARKK